MNTVQNETRTASAVAYLRCSGLGQVDGDSFPRQIEAINSFAVRHSFEIVAEFRDEGVSGTVESEGREGFSEMIERIASNCVRVVIVERSDRLARDLMVSEMLISRLKRLGVRVIDASSGMELTDSTDPSRVLMRQIMGAVDQYGKSELVAKLRKARRRIRESSGRCEGRKPYGSREGEYSTLTRIMALDSKSMSSRSIAETLNAEGLVTRYGHAWNFGSVARLIRLAKARQDRFMMAMSAINTQAISTSQATPLTSGA